MCLGVYLSHSPHVELRGQHGGVISLLPLCRFRGLNPSGRTWQRAPLPPWANSLASSFIFHFFGACSTRSLGYWLFIIYSEPSTKKKYIKKHGKVTFRHLWSKSEAGCEETLAFKAFRSSGTSWGQVSTVVHWRPRAASVRASGEASCWRAERCAVLAQSHVCGSPFLHPPPSQD